MATPFDTQRTATPAAADLDSINHPSDKQVLFAAALLHQREWQTGGQHYVSRAADIMVAIDAAKSKVDMHYGRALNIELAAQGHKMLTRSGISKLIELLYACPHTKAQADSQVHSDDIEGFWVVEGEIVKVQIAVHGSGRPYGKRLDTETGKFVYGKGLLGPIRRGEAERLTLDRAKALGHLYGRCVCCGATLTNEESIEAGIGPICASKF
ncbi:hypothetical protein SEA_EVAA_40 [Gordonia phage Evaa]|nr:hypothetical protein SEA_EVAA_40 [Gordonia phage Evaa]